MANTKLLEARVKELNSQIDPYVFKSIKSILTRVRGEQFEFIEKLTLEDALQCMTSCGLSHQSHIENLDHVNIGLPGFPITLHYDQIIVKNDEGNYTTIRDVFIRFFVNGSGKLQRSIFNFFSMISLGRTYEQTRLSFNGNSHGGSAAIFATFCTGQGPINECIEICHIGKFVPKNFEAFLVALKAYFEWENTSDKRTLEKMSHHHSTLLPINRKTDLAPHLDKIVRTLTPEDMKSLKFSFSSSNTIKVSTLRDFEKKLGKRLMELGLNKLLAYKAPNGIYYSADKSLIPMYNFLPQTSKTFLRYKGEDKFLYAVQEDTRWEDYMVAHPSVIGDICKRISQEMTMYMIHKSSNNVLDKTQTYEKKRAYGKSWKD